MRPDPSSDDLVDRLELHHMQFVSASTLPGLDDDTPTAPADEHSTQTTEPAAPTTRLDAETRNRLRARRLTMMATTQVGALVGAFAAMNLPWYRVEVPATQLMTAAGQLVNISPATVSATGFDVVRNGATSPYCPAAPMMWGLPVPLTFATLTVALIVVAVVLRSVIAGSAAVVTALQAVRHLGIMHDSVVGGPEGCMIGQIETAVGRPLFIITLTAVVTLAGLTLLQLWLLRNAEKQAKIAAGEPVPPSLVAMIQGRLVGVAAAVVAEAQRR
jgi:hypothetical protein